MWKSTVWLYTQNQIDKDRISYHCCFWSLPLFWLCVWFGCDEQGDPGEWLLSLTDGKYLFSGFYCPCLIFLVDGTASSLARSQGQYQTVGHGWFLWVFLNTVNLHLKLRIQVEHLRATIFSKRRWQWNKTWFRGFIWDPTPAFCLLPSLLIHYILPHPIHTKFFLSE